MSFRWKLLVAFTLVFCTVNLKAQTTADSDIEALIESIAENVSEEFDYSELAERLAYYHKKPLNINKATREELEQLVFLSPLQINNLMDYRIQNGRFLDFFELQAVDGFDNDAIRKLLPFIRLEEVNALQDLDFKKAFTKANNDAFFRFGRIIQQQKGFQKATDADQLHYVGSSYRILGKYKYDFGSAISATICMKKDAGEQMLSKANNFGFDFYSGNISFKNLGAMKRLVIGDYSLQFGQGLTLWTGLSFGKGAAIAAITKNDIGLKPYTSTNELLFLRGVSAGIQLKHFVVTPFVSYRSLDAGIENSNGENRISSFSQTGFHRTSTELSNRSSVSQTVFGSNIQYTAKKLRLGATTYYTVLSMPVAAGEALYKKYDFAGNKLTNLGAYYSYSIRNMYVFGEAAHSINSGYAYLNGLMCSLSPKVSVMMFHRDYQKDYHSFFNQAVSEGTNAVNEKGFYSGLTISPTKKIEWSAYADLFRSPWLRYRVDAPSSGYELLSQLSYSPSKKMKIVLRYKLENKEENDDLDNIENFIEEVKKQNYRLELNYKISDNVQMRNRIEISGYGKGLNVETGSLAIQDIIYNPLQSRFSGNMRFALFDTPGFNSRIYAFENDVLFSYSVPAYQNKGLRFYANGRYRLNKAADIWVRYAISAYSDLKTIGSGLDQIDGNKKSDIKFQLRFQF